MKQVSVSEQITSIERLNSYQKKKKKRKFPDITVELYSNGDDYHIVATMEDGKREHITNVKEVYDMDSEFFMNNIIGEIAHYLGIGEYCIERMFYRYRYD